MTIFHSYVCLPEGAGWRAGWPEIPFRWAALVYSRSSACPSRCHRSCRPGGFQSIPKSWMVHGKSQIFGGSPIGKAPGHAHFGAHKTWETPEKTPGEEVNGDAQLDSFYKTGTHPTHPIRNHQSHVGLLRWPTESMGFSISIRSFTGYKLTSPPVMIVGL